MTKFIERMIRDGKTTQEKVDAALAKSKAIDDALAAYTAGKATMTKAQIVVMMDTIVAAKPVDPKVVTK